MFWGVWGRVWDLGFRVRVKGLGSPHEISNLVALQDQQGYWLSSSKSAIPATSVALESLENFMMCALVERMTTRKALMPPKCRRNTIRQMSVRKPLSTADRQKEGKPGSQNPPSQSERHHLRAHRTQSVRVFNTCSSYEVIHESIGLRV